jgi:hypothetical protein
VKQGLSVAQTLTAGVLLEAALLKRDDSILVHINGKDCVAIEARYHKRCYQMYTKCVSRKQKAVAVEPTLYDKAFDQFCAEIIEKRIIENKEVVFLGQLLNEFIKCVQTIENVQVTYQAARLKKRIQKRYPQIVFHASKTVRKGTLVYVDNVTAGEVADDFTAIPSGDDDTDGMDSDNEDDGAPSQPVKPTSFPLKELFFAAMEIKKLLMESKGVDAEWPPDSNDLTLELATRCVPVRLYNFLAWCLGYSCDPIEDGMVNLSPSEKRKVVSIAQDLIYAESKGKKLTHKSLALGMTVRQMTGSIRLLKILYGLGHTTSVATVYKHDTALALTTTQGQEIVIPRNIRPGAFATIIWDNNDFNEETVSGKGTTHVANGIIVQNGNVSLQQKIAVSKKQRTMTAPQTNIIPYVNREKGTISLRNQSSDIFLEERLHADKQDLARNAYFVCLVARKYASEGVKTYPDGQDSTR